MVTVEVKFAEGPRQVPAHYATEGCPPMPLLTPDPDDYYQFELVVDGPKGWEWHGFRIK